jgi:ELWxxDGT repeat protein
MRRGICVAVAVVVALTLVAGPAAAATLTAVLVKDINPGSGDSLASAGATVLTNVNGTVFFRADDGTHGMELWKSDGTEAGTVLVKDINPGSGGSLETFYIATNAGGTLFISADDGTHGMELWKSDGTEAGTVLVSDINPFGSSIPDGLTYVNGTLLFDAEDGTHGRELWKSDGTEAGTVLVKDIDPSYGSDPDSLTNVNGTLLFSADDGTIGYELWKSDGTEAGTVLVKDINPGFQCSCLGSLTNVDGTLFFSAIDGTHGGELWKSDGTDAGTVLVKDINPDSAVSPGSPYPGAFINVDGTLFFRDDDGTSGVEPWKSDGTEAGTVLVKDINPGSDGSLHASNFQFGANVNGTVFFSADDGAIGFELWKSDGTTAGTVLVKDISPGSASSDPFWLAGVNGTLFFNAFGVQLWMSDGTTAGTVPVQDTLGSSDPEALTDVNGTLFFAAEDRINGRELRKLTTDTQLTGDLISRVQSLGLPRGTETSLVSKLTDALAALNASPSDAVTACDDLDSFISEVTAQSGRKIPVADANALIAQAEQIETAIGCT